MKRIFIILISFIMLLGLSACTATYNSPDKLVERVRKEIPISDADKIEINYAGMAQVNNNVLLWYISGNENQSHYYFPVECSMTKNGKYKFERSYKAMIRIADIAVLEWENGYVFCVNNSECHVIRIVDELGTHDIEVNAENDSFVYYHNSIPIQYDFLDSEGKSLEL